MSLLDVLSALGAALVVFATKHFHDFEHVRIVDLVTVVAKIHADFLEDGVVAVAGE